MQSILRHVPGVAAALVAFSITKLFGWTELGVELGVFLGAYVVTLLLVDRGMKRYGTRAA